MRHLFQMEGLIEFWLQTKHSRVQVEVNQDHPLALHPSAIAVFKYAQTNRTWVLNNWCKKAMCEYTATHQHRVKVKREHEVHENNYANVTDEPAYFFYTQLIAL